MKPIALAVGLTLAALAASPVFAHDRNYDEDYYTYARVVDVEPHYRTVRVATPERQCYEEEVPYRRSQGGDSYTGIIAGGLIGGVLGSNIGHGRGRSLATIGGALLGGSVGRDLTRNQYDRGYVQTEVRERCDVVNHYHNEQQAAGYQVTYRYEGRNYEVHTDSRPGRKIRVRVPDDNDGYRQDPDYRDYNDRNGRYDRISDDSNY